MNYVKLNRLVDYFLKVAGIKCSQINCNFESDNKADFITVLDGNPPGMYCKKHGTFCHSCGHPVATNMARARPIGVPGRVGFYCKTCDDKEFNRCEECDEVKHDDLIKDPNDKRICRECFNELWYTCPNCDEVVEPDDSLTRKYTKWINGQLIKKEEKGCIKCLGKCYSCGKTKESDEINRAPDGEKYCNDCYSDHWRMCEECHEEFYIEEMHYIEHPGIEVCDRCYDDNYGHCTACKEELPINELTQDSEDGDWYCEKCFEGRKATPEEYNQFTTLEQVSVNKYSRLLDQLKKLLPISIKELKIKYPKLADGLAELVKFSGGKDLTVELVEAFEQHLASKVYPIRYSVWKSSLQRSVKSATPQLVINVIAPPELIQEMEVDKSYNLFEKINEVSKQSGHPMIKDQLGWIRVELHPDEKYLLVDEIQADHLNALDRINKESYQGEEMKESIKRKLRLSEEEWMQICNNLKKHVKDFPDIAMQTIKTFAKNNGFKNIYYHTYESGKELKRNYPPKSLYTTLPEKHFFLPTQEKPFGLEGKFLGREARKNFLDSLKLLLG